MEAESFKDWRLHILKPEATKIKDAFGTNDLYTSWSTGLFLDLHGSAEMNVSSRISPLSGFHFWTL